MNIQQPKKQSFIDQVKDFSANKPKIVVILIVVFFTLVGWFFRYQATPVSAGVSGGAVEYLNRWTGNVVIVPLYGRSNSINLLAK